jgi:ribA/ribD-fused uncharacterized protein
MVGNAMRMVQAGLERGARPAALCIDGVQLRCAYSYWEAPPPRSRLSTHAPVVIPGVNRDEHVALDDYTPFEAFCSQWRSGYVESEGCAAGMRNAEGQSIMKTTRWHCFGDALLAAAEAGIGLQRCRGGHVHGSLRARPVTGGSFAFVGQQAEVYTAVQGCTLGELTLAGDGRRVESLVVSAQQHQETEQMRSAGGGAGLPSQQAGQAEGGLVLFYSSGTEHRHFSAMYLGYPFKGCAGSMPQQLQWLAKAVDEKHFKSRENFFAFAKVIMVSLDPRYSATATAKADEVLRASAFDARKLTNARALKGLNVLEWDRVSEMVMETAARGQLAVHGTFRAALAATGTALIAEASEHDSSWGIGYDAAAAISVPRSAWGDNRHGKLLMRLRDEPGGPPTGAAGADVLASGVG